MAAAASTQNSVSRIRRYITDIHGNYIKGRRTLILIIIYRHIHYSVLHANYEHHYESIINRHTHSSGFFFGNYRNECALPAGVAGVPR